MKSLFEMIALQLLFFTRIPLPFEVNWAEGKFSRGLPFYPLIGAGMGAIAAAVILALSSLQLPVLSVILALTVLTILGGGLHLDGLADTADGFFSGRDRERILEIMRDSRIGTNGTVALILIFLLKGSALLSLEHPLMALVCSTLFARVSMIFTAAFSSYARTGSGMGMGVISDTGVARAFVSSLVALPFAVALFSPDWKQIVILFAVAVIGGIAMARYSTSKIGGTTGDVLGAQVELMETVLLVLCAVLGKTL